MAKQTAAAQKRTEAEARKAAKLVASSAAASSQVDPLSSQAGEAGSHASKATVSTASGMSLPLTATDAGTAKQFAGGPKAELHVAADNGQQEGLATATDSGDRPQLTLGGRGNAAKSAAVGASADQDENQASNGLVPGGTSQLMISSDGQAGNGKSKPGKKRAAEALGTEGGPRGGHSRSTRSKTGA